MASRGRTLRRGPVVFRVVRARPRLFISLGLGVVIIAVLAVATDWRLATRLLVGWDATLALYFALVAHLMAVSDTHRIRGLAAQEDEGRVLILVLTVAAALASLVAIFAQLGSAAGAGKGDGRGLGQVVFAIATILLSWGFIHTMFALHYAHEFYDETAGGLTFPGEKEPDYWDFVYFAFVVGMTSQVSDVAVTARPIRRIVAAHGVISFVFNMALLALTINLAAGAMMGGT